MSTTYPDRSAVLHNLSSRALLDRLVVELNALESLRSIILLGSYSRGDYDETSDIDLLVISDDRETLSSLRRLLPKGLVTKNVSLIRYSTGSFFRQYRKKTLFMYHAFTEGTVIKDDGILSGVKERKFTVSHEDLQLQWAIAKHRVEDLEDFSIYGRIFCDPLGQLYPLTKKVCIVALAFGGHFVFNRQMVYRAMTKKFPELASHLEELYGLRPFALVWKKGTARGLPFPTVNSRSETMHFTSLLKQVINRVELSESGTNTANSL